MTQAACMYAREGVELWLYSWLCVCAKNRWNSGYTLHALVPEKGWNSEYIHGSLFVPEKQHGSIFMPYWNHEPSDKGYITQNHGKRWKVGPGPGQTITEMTYHGINQSVIFFVAQTVFCTYARNICNINSIITMYGNTKVTPAMHGCHGNFMFYQ